MSLLRFVKFQPHPQLFIFKSQSALLCLSALFSASRTSSPHHIVIHSHGLLPEEHRILLCIILRFLLKMIEYSTFDKLRGHTQKKKSDPQTLRQHSWCSSFSCCGNAKGLELGPAESPSGFCVHFP